MPESVCQFLLIKGEFGGEGCKGVLNRLNKIQSSRSCRGLQLNSNITLKFIFNFFITLIWVLIIKKISFVYYFCFVYNKIIYILFIIVWEHSSIFYDFLFSDERFLSGKVPYVKVA